jgi:16S rRNA (cytosine1402-N4)-methyltransferase
VPYKYRYFRIHPATRTFQAVRIAVNREMETLQSALVKSFDLLNQKARVCVISFHSLEDRIVKHTFRDFAEKGVVEIITPKPLTPDYAEIKDNHLCRSAKLRVAEKL